MQKISSSMDISLSASTALMLVLGLGLISSSDASLTYPTLPEGNYSTSSTSPGQSGLTSSLSYLFQMSNGFTNIVFLTDFNALQDWLYQLVKSEDILAYLQSSYNELLKLEMGFLACLAFGVLFLILVIFGGLIMCCCRTCCGGCGGKMTQSAKRRKSKWRYCHCFSLLICTIFMIVPAVFIFITNQWITEILNILPTDLTTDVDNIGEYISVIPKQLNASIDGYDVLDESVRTNFNDIGTVLGGPVQTDITTLVQPALTQLDILDAISTNTMGNLTALNTTANTMVAGVNNLEAQVALSKAALLAFLDTDQTACDGNTACNDLKAATNALSISIDVSELISVTSKINSVAASIQSTDTAGIISTVNSQLNDIPGFVVNASASTTTQVLSALDSAKSTLASASSAIPQSTLDSLMASLNDVKSQINTILGPGSQYIEPYQLYRDLAFYVLGGIVLLVCTLYLFGLLFGSVSYSHYTQPKYRSCCSDCGGVLIMMGVGFSFIFAWLLMILVILTFSLGGPAERYACQPLEAPYDGLKFADRAFPVTIPVTDSAGVTQNLNISIYDTVMACQQNQAIYTALNLESVLNATALVQNVTNNLNVYQQDLTAITIDLSSIDIYSNDTEDKLDQLTTMGLSDVTVNTTKLNNALDDASNTLTAFAATLNTSADAIQGDATLDGLNYPATIRAYSYNFTLIESSYLQPLKTSVADLNTYMDALDIISASLNSTVATTKTQLQATDTDLQTNGNAVVTAQVTAFANNIFDDVNGYTAWFLTQLTDNIGACLPLYNAYADIVALTCSYAIDTISGLWFSLGWIVFFLMPAAIFGMKLAKFYRRFQNKDYEADGVGHMNGGKSTKGRIRSARIHPSEYY